MTSSFSTPVPQYPVAIEIEPAVTQSRLTILFRWLLAIPTLVIGSLLYTIAGLLSIIAWFVILFTGRYPAGFQTFTAGSLRWYVRASGYSYFLTGMYPPFSMDEESQYPIRIDIESQLENRNRLTVAFRIILVIPHIIIITLLGYVMSVVILIAWIIGIFAGREPDGLHRFIGGYLRWSSRVNAYHVLLVDEYPPFSFD